MSRYTGAKLKITRKLGYLPGLTGKRRKFFYNRPRRRRKKTSKYGIRLKEKQKVRFNYGLTEKQLINYMKKAKKFKGSTGTNFLQLIEMRLDNILFRLCWTPTIPSARQMVGHKHITVNNLRVSLPSYQCKLGDSIGFRKARYEKRVLSLLGFRRFRLPPHLVVVRQTVFPRLKGRIIKMVRIPGNSTKRPYRRRRGITASKLLLIEYYSRKI